MNARGLGIVILAAGASTRMGRQKLLLPWRTTSVLGHVVQQWLKLKPNQIVVVCRPNADRLIREIARLGIPRLSVVKNRHPDRGMFSSIQCAARWTGWQKAISCFGIVLGDQPQIRLATLRKLLSFQRRHAAAICQPAFAGRPRHPVLLPRGAFEQIGASKASDLKSFLERQTGVKAQCSIEDPGLAMDLDTPHDYERVKPFRPP